MVKKLNEQQLADIDNEIKDCSISYEYDTKQYPVEVIIQKHESEKLIVPTYQRQFVWDKTLKSRFIESVLLGVPIMPILVSFTEENGELEIIDGSQRIRTLVEFIHNELKLQHLEKLTKLNGLRFEQLSEKTKNILYLRDFRFHVIKADADSETRADIFKRINVSSVKLTPSEIRKGSYNEGFYVFIRELSEDALFRKVCPIPEAKIKRGEYEELILRFFAYSDDYQNFNKKVTYFLDNFLNKHSKKFDKERYLNEFNKVNHIVEQNLAPFYFSYQERKNSTPRVRYEALAVGINLALRENPELVIDTEMLNELIKSAKFDELTTSDASNNKLKARIEYVKEYLINYRQQI